MLPTQKTESRAYEGDLAATSRDLSGLRAQARLQARKGERVFFRLGCSPVSVVGIIRVVWVGLL